jgi:SAM-dependent methyltransferase
MADTMATGLSESIRRMIPYRFRRLLKGGTETLSSTEILRIELKQLKDILRLEHGFIPPPPMELQTRVLGLYSPYFIESGWRTFEVFEKALAGVGCLIRRCETVLDFGCGCGRVLRAFHHMSPQAKLFGSDIDPEAIQWLNQNCQQWAHFSTNAASPPFAFSADSFDLIYSISVFTHLPEAMQISWLAELQRVAKSGSFVLATVHGEEQHSVLNASNRAEFIRTGFCYVEEKTPTTEGLPAFYQTTFHSRDYIRNVWSRYFEVVTIDPLAVDGHSDLIILKKR